MKDKFKKGDKVKVYGGTEVHTRPSKNTDRCVEFHWNDGHTAVVCGILRGYGDYILVKFDGKCGDIVSCAGKGYTELAHINQCRKIKKVK